MSFDLELLVWRIFLVLLFGPFVVAGGGLLLLAWRRLRGRRVSPPVHRPEDGAEVSDA